MCLDSILEIKASVDADYFNKNCSNYLSRFTQEDEDLINKDSKHQRGNMMALAYNAI